MKLTIDTVQNTLQVHTADGTKEHPLYSPESMTLLSEQWVNVGWALRYSYGFSWMGRPVIQLPEDMIRMQEVIYRIQPDIIIETGVAHGGSLIYYASLCKAMGRGRVVGVDIEIRPANRSAIEAHDMSPLITLIEGSSTAPEVVSQVKSLIEPGDKVLVILDSDHSRAHVADELEAYAPFVTIDSYIVATDGIMQDLHEVPGGQPGWLEDNPQTAAREFVVANPDFKLEVPAPGYSESGWPGRATYWPGAYLRRLG